VAGNTPLRTGRQRNSLVRLAIRIARNLAIVERRRRPADQWDETTMERAGMETRVKLRAPQGPMLRTAIEKCRSSLPKPAEQALAVRLASRGVAPDETLAERLTVPLITFLQNVGCARTLLAESLHARGAQLNAPPSVSDNSASSIDPLVEAVTSAWRPRDLGGGIRFHPAWHDLDDSEREQTFKAAWEMRAIETALDPDSRSLTVHAVLARIRV
jgi:hypothetical protein